MDALSNVLRASRLTGGVFLQAEFSEPWCVASQVTPEDCAPFHLEAKQVIGYHYIINGCARVRVDGQPEIEAGPGDVLLFPRNHRHRLGSDVSLPPADADEYVEVPETLGLATIRYGGGGPVCNLICGFLGCDEGDANPVIAALPPAFKLCTDSVGAAEWIRSTFQFAAEEVAAGTPGSATLLSKLSELLFVEAVRRYTDLLSEDATGWLAGLKDPFISRALAMIHNDIAMDWTVDELGRGAGLSRSALAERFTRLIGKSPKQYVIGLRMQRAAEMLQDSSLGISQIAAKVGYDSDAAFSRAFKKVYETAPATWRRTHTQ